MPPELGDRLLDESKNILYEVTETTVYGVKLTVVPNRNDKRPIAEQIRYPNVISTADPTILPTDNADEFSADEHTQDAP